ncbi:hypothetical protein [Streptomyces sp. Ncost-T10-10d]|uniref:hypothetical protein n=1 Tax=Streptomyces sp. Ncost-T10-10d TaxID=1839774 RepID=UPI00081E7AD3|nr:hypothetical protein [Streptomyces sp. Ncost-T10-10d]SCF83426.1 hypothetical protein GA0115254_1185106 [Streptomyces sp. Ncost-T10-10d]
MDRPDHLRAEDLPSFERILDHALNSPAIQEKRRHTPRALNNEQLRTRALGARTAIAASAASEYRAYRQLLAASASSGATLRRARRESDGAAANTSSTLHAVAVLVPGLSATAAAVFGLIGFAFRAVDMHSHLADVMLSAGLAATGVAVVTVLAGLVWMLVAAARNRSAAGGMDPEVDHARDAWQEALLERGILPFLSNSLQTVSLEDVDRPDVTDTSRAAGGAKGVPEPRRGPGFSAPDISSPGFSGPDFTGPKLPGAD